MRNLNQSSIIRKIHGDGKSDYVCWKDVIEITVSEIDILHYKDWEQSYFKIYLDFSYCEVGKL